jgi:hypothetical protein
VPGTNGVIRVLRSPDGEKWDSAARVAARGIDLRDAKLDVMPDGRLMLLMGGSVYAGEEGPKTRRRITLRSRVSFSNDGRAWSPPQPVSVPEGDWLWRVTWHVGHGYGFSYRRESAASKFHITFWRTTDGIHYERLPDPRPPAESSPGEATLRFLADQTLVALVRGEQTNRHAFTGRSAPPYSTWQWADAGRAAQGPDCVVLPDQRMFYAGRDFSEGAKTVLGQISADRCTPLLTLPSGGDTSYPGLVWHDGLMWMSYYSSHEGKTAIYLAKIRLKSGD